ncbi:MAG: hypothetical protein QXF83_06905 [Candidatus Bathyarchaeia archaeon]
MKKNGEEKMKTAGKMALGGLIVILLLFVAWAGGLIQIKLPSAPSGGGGQQPPTTGQLGRYPIQFMVKARNGTGIGYAIVEVYHDTDGNGVWELVGTYTADSSGKVSSGADTYLEGERLMVHVKGGTYSGKKVTDTWVEVSAAYKQPDLTYIYLQSDVIAWIAPSSSSYLDIKVFDKDWNAIGESDAAATQLSLASGAADWVTYPGTLKLIINQKWTAFGGSIAQPNTNQKHVAKTWVSVVTIEFNRTDISFASGGGWTQVSGTSSNVKKFAIRIDRLEATTTIPVSLEIPLKFKATGLPANTPFKMIVSWYDFQIWEDVTGNIFNTSAVEPDPAATYTISKTFYFRVVA